MTTTPTPWPAAPPLDGILKLRPRKLYSRGGKPMMSLAMRSAEVTTVQHMREGREVAFRLNADDGRSVCVRVQVERVWVPGSASGDLCLRVLRPQKGSLATLRLVRVGEELSFDAWRDECVVERVEAVRGMRLTREVAEAEATALWKRVRAPYGAVIAL